jgi:hypothetical protein
VHRCRITLGYVLVNQQFFGTNIKYGFEKWWGRRCVGWGKMGRGSGGRRGEKADERGGAPVICVKWCGIMRNIWGLIS